MNLRGLLHKYMYRDTATVLRGVKVQIGKTDDFDVEWQTIYADIPCKLSQYGKSLTASRNDRAQDLHIDLRLTCEPEIDIRPNDYLTVHHRGQTFELIAGTPFNYATHKEISVRRRKEAGQT